MQGEPGKPLSGIGVLLTRTRAQAASLAAGIGALGAEVFVVPTVSVEPVEDPEGLRQAISGIGSYDHLVFTSVNGVSFFLERMEGTGLQPGTLPSALCVGSRTAAAWEAGGGRVAAVPERFTAAELARTQGKDLSGRSYLVLRPEKVSTPLGDLLRERGAAVDEVVLYRTITPPTGGSDLGDLLDRGVVDVVVYASPSAVRGALEMAGGPERIGRIPALCIGPTTAQAAREAGLARVTHPTDHTVEGIISRLLAMAGELGQRR
ncbi:MAG: uroporphyrinogen-III synthase [bacterium]|nr:MAG: uroporphyrinogen-III synthase [bacterium]